MALREFSKEELLLLFDSRIESSDKMKDGFTQELRDYVKAAFNRIFFTLGLIKKHYQKGQGKILEIGSFPFFFSAALSELSDDQITGIVSPETIWPGEPSPIIEKAISIKTKDKQYPFRYWTLNVEKDRFPFADESFDLVLCTEVLEHLIQSPASMLYEINRVLKRGGLLILTTPNGLFWQFIYKLMFYGNWEQYSKYGVYGRHNRLWVPNEVNDFLKGNNFQILESLRGYAQVKRLEFPKRQGLKPVDMIQDLFLLLSALFFSLPVPFLKKKDGDQLYIAAKKIEAPKFYSPGYLYSDKFSYNLEK